MNRALRILCVLFAAGFLVVGARVHAAFPVEGAAATAAYWLRADGDAPLLTAEEIAGVNRAIAARTDTLCNLMEHPMMLTGDEVRRRIQRAAQGLDAAAPTGLYAQGQPLSAAAWQQVLGNCAAHAVEAEVLVHRAVAVQRADVRLLPSTVGWFSSPEDVHYDALQGTVLDPGEAVLVLHASADGRFSLVQAEDYCGWVDARQLATADAVQWQAFAAPEEFFTVTRALLRLTAHGETFLYQLGARIPGTRADDHTLRLQIPGRDVGGHLFVQELQTAADERLAAGRLALTHNNIVRLAFSALGTEYGWGGANEGMDCSSYLQDIYRAMGISLPRDADAQEDAVGHLSLMGRTADARNDLFRGLPTGAMLFRPGHVMLYLGVNDAGQPLVIHDVSSIYENGAKRYVRKVVVSDLAFQNARGAAARDTITHVGAIFPGSFAQQ